MSTYTVDEVATLLGVSRQRINTLIFEGKLTARKELRVLGARPTRWGGTGPFKKWLNVIDENELNRYRRARIESLEAKRPERFIPAMIESYNIPRVVDLAWLGGIVDGEGYLGLTQKLMRSTAGTTWIGYTPTLVVAMNSEFVCRRAYDIIGAGKVFLKEVRFDKEHWAWRCRNNDAATALQLLLPFLMEKSYQAQLVLRGAIINASYQADRDWRARLPERSAELRALAGELISLHGQSGGRHSRKRSSELLSALDPRKEALSRQIL